MSLVFINLLRVNKKDYVFIVKHCKDIKKIEITKAFA